MGKIYGLLLLELQSLVFRLFKWFENNHIKANPGKSHILLNNKETEITWYYSRF